jgi:hypothetical protein
VIGLEISKLAEASFCVYNNVLVFRKIYFSEFNTTHWLTTAAAMAVSLNIATITAHVKTTSVCSHHFTSYVVYVPTTNTGCTQFTLPHCQYS